TPVSLRRFSTSASPTRRALKRCSDVDVEHPGGLKTTSRIDEPEAARDDFAVPVMQREPGGPIAPIKGIYRLAGSLCVLLRHRSRVALRSVGAFPASQHDYFRPTSAAT